MSAARRLAMTTTATAVGSDTARIRHAQIIELKATLGRNIFALGAALTEMRDRELYRALGYPTFEDYLVSEEVRMQRRTAYSFMRIFQSFRPVQQEALRLDWGKLDILTQIIKEGDAPEQILPLLDEAATIPRDELRERVRAGKQQRMIAPQPADVQHVAHDNNLPTYPSPAAPVEWTRVAPIEATYAVDAATPPDPWDEPPAVATVAPTPLLSAVALVPALPEVVRVPVEDSTDDGDLSVREYAIHTKYTHLIEDMLKIAHKHRETLAEIDRREIEPLMTAADRDRESSVLVVCDWFGALVRPMQLRRVR